MSFMDNLRKIASEISARHRYLRGDKGVLEKTHKQLKDWQPDGKIEKTGRVLGLGGIDLSWFLFCFSLLRYIFMTLLRHFVDFFRFLFVAFSCIMKSAKSKHRREGVTQS